MARKQKVLTLDDLKSEHPWLTVLLDTHQKAIESSKMALKMARGLDCQHTGCNLSEKTRQGSGLCAVHKLIEVSLSAIDDTEPYVTRP